MSESAKSSAPGETSGEESGKKKPKPADEGGSPTRPTPVRDLMRPDEAEAESSASPSPAPPPSVELEIDGIAWRVEVVGRTRSGTAPDTGAPLLLLRFRRETEGEGREAEREAWAVSRSLSDLSELQLEELFGRSRPMPEDRDEAAPEFGPGRPHGR